MSDFNPGDAVQWTRRGVARIGVVEHAFHTSNYVYVKPSWGNRHWVHKDRLTRILVLSGANVSDSALVAAIATLPMDDSRREDAIASLRKEVK